MKLRWTGKQGRVAIPTFEEWMTEFEGELELKDEYEERLEDWVADTARLNPQVELSFIRADMAKDWPYQMACREFYKEWIDGYLEGLKDVKIRQVEEGSSARSVYRRPTKSASGKSQPTAVGNKDQRKRMAQERAAEPALTKVKKGAVRGRSPK